MLGRTHSGGGGHCEAPGKLVTAALWDMIRGEKKVKGLGNFQGSDDCATRNILHKPLQLSRGITRVQSPGTQRLMVHSTLTLFLFLVVIAV